jgi:creatinine amidohydrolase/Fe(II)-dependent formamide hydrolase-like protein
MEKAVNNTLKYKSRFRNTDGMASSRVFWSTWGLEETETGVLGDPTKASPELGEKAFKYIVEEISGFAREYYRHKKEQ